MHPTVFFLGGGRVAPVTRNAVIGPRRIAGWYNDLSSLPWAIHPPTRDFLG